MTRLLLFIITVLSLYSCKNSEKEKEISNCHNKPVEFSPDNLSDLINESKISLSLNFVRELESNFGEKEVKIRCNYTILNSSEDAIIVNTTDFYNYDLYKIVNIESGEEVELGWSSFSGKNMCSPQKIEPNSTYTDYFFYEAFECFIANRSFEDGSPNYGFEGNYMLHHTMFPDSGITFHINKEGVITCKYYMEEQDSPSTL